MLRKVLSKSKKVQINMEKIQIKAKQIKIGDQVGIGYKGTVIAVLTDSVNMPAGKIKVTVKYPNKEYTTFWGKETTIIVIR